MNLFIHRMLGHFLQNEAGAEGGEGGGGGQQPTPTPAPAPAPTPAPAPGGSVLDQGAGNDYIPEKLRVTNADGTINVDASSRKVAEAYSALEKRMGTGDAPPKSAEDYAPKVEVEGFSFDEFKADPVGSAFLKGAHAKGLTNDQVAYVLSAYVDAVPELLQGNAALSTADCTAELKTVWKDDKEFSANVGHSYRAAQTFANQGDGPGSFDRLMAKYGNDPDFLAFTANIGKEIREDSPINNASPANDADFNVRAAELRKQLEETPMHDPKRVAIKAQYDALYASRYNTGSRLK